MTHDDIEKRRKELEMTVDNQQMTDRSKYELIRKIMDILEESMEEDN